MHCSSAVAQSRDLRISLSDCMPNGVIGNVMVRLDPKEFWIGQHVLLDMQLNRAWEYKEALDSCNDRKDSKNRQECLIYHRSHWDSLRRCLVVTRQMCRLHGAC
jgi:hypothetical protein